MEHSLPVEEVLKKHNTSRAGLSETEGMKRLEGGRNELETRQKNSLFLMYLSQFADLMVLLLIGAAIVSAVTAVMMKSSDGLVDTFIIVFIIFLNATVGFLQQYKADKALEKLKKITMTEVKVKRGGSVKSINSALVVAGDIVLLGEGDMVPADMRLIEAESLTVDESALTGESQRVVKNTAVVAAGAPLGDRRDMVYSSTFVTRGSGWGVVTATGMNTEMGKIARMIGGKEDLTPLQKKLNGLSKFISFAVIGIALIIFAVSLITAESGLLDNFMSAVAIAVAAIPEGLPAVVTIIMAMGMQKMVKFHAIVRKLHVVETLGSCTCICSDKTGTLTQNKMQVTGVWCAKEGKRKLIECMSICGTVGGRYGAYVGDPTEIALKEYAYKEGFRSEVRFQKSIPFDSERKMMSVAAGGVVYSKGAPDILLKKCSRIITEQGIRPLTSADTAAVMRENDRMAGEALRVLGLAYKEGELSEDGLVFIGLAGMMDPPRLEAAASVAECRRAGIRPVMITGDHKTTAFAVAKKLGIAARESEVVTGDELDKLSDDALRRAVKRASVFARVSPHHKLRIVEALKKNGEVVAMTGDGINDAPSIKRADIGISMGSGTDVTKNASDMIVSDDNFSTIVVAVKEGRRIFANIKKTIQFFLATNLAEVISIFVVSVFFHSLGFLSSSQLLWINLITDSFPVLALGVEKAEKNVMDKPPENPKKSLFSKASYTSIFYYGIVQTAIVLTVFFTVNGRLGNAAASTMTFFTLSFVELIHAFNIRSERSLFMSNVFSNPVLIFTVIGAIALNVAMCYIPPVAAAFDLVKLDIGQWGYVFACSLAVLPAGELYKLAVRIIRRRSPLPRKLYDSKPETL